MKRIFIIFLVLVSLYIIVTTAYQWLPSGNSAANGTVDGDIEEIEIELEGAHAEIRKTSGDQLETELEGKGEISVEKDGHTLKVKYDRKFWFSNPFKRTASVTISVPENYDRDLIISGGSGTVNLDGEDDWQLGELEVTLGSGKLSAHNIHASDVSIKASSGYVNVDGVKAEDSEFRISSGKADINNVQAEYVSLAATSGNIDADSITAKETDTNFSSGSFSLNNITGGLTGQLSSGKLAVHFKEVTNAIDLNASSGRVQLDLPDDGDYTLNGEYNSGHISASLPLENKTESQDSISGKIGTGTHEVNISVTSGSAEIN